jgi:hypothetical protein
VEDGPADSCGASPGSVARGTACLRVRGCQRPPAPRPWLWRFFAFGLLAPQIMGQVLSVALYRAVREELVARNVARLVELPAWEPAEVVPWSPAEALAFLNAATGDPPNPAFVLLLLYGMRAGGSPRPALARHRPGRGDDSYPPADPAGTGGASDRSSQETSWEP